jgi:hypothetical protein
VNLSNEFNPVPKPSFKKAKSRKKRNEISKQEYQRAVEEFGDCCVLCKRHPIEMHHVRFRSPGGRGTFRNLMPLCKKHHVMAHTSRPLADQLRADREQKYGKWYGADRHDLYMHGLIKDITFESFENFMLREERKHEQS